MLSTKVEQRFTIPGYETYATTVDGVRFKLEFENKLTGKINHDLTTRVYARFADKFSNEIVTQSLPFTD